MTRALACLLCAFALAGCIAVSQQPASVGTTTREMKIAFDVTDGNPKALDVKLATIELTRKQIIERGDVPKIVVAFRGDASYYTQVDHSLIKEADRAEAPKIAARIRELRNANGIDSIEQCNIPLASRKLKSADLMPEVKLVPNGWIALVGYQQKGYAYIAP